MALNSFHDHHAAGQRSLIVVLLMGQLLAMSILVGIAVVWEVRFRNTQEEAKAAIKKMDAEIKKIERDGERAAEKIRRSINSFND